MIKKILFCFFTLTTCFSFSQEEIGTFENVLKTSVKDVKESFSIINQENGNIATFLLEKKQVYGYLLNNKFEVIKSLTTKNKRRKYTVFIGKMYDQKTNYTIISCNEKRTQFALINFNFDDKKTTVSEDKFNTKGLIFLQSVNRKNKVHLLFLDRKTSNIISRTYYINGNIESTTFNFKNEKFLITDTKEVELKKLLPDYKKKNHREIKNISYELTKINVDNYTIENDNIIHNLKKVQISPTSIQTAVRINKLYINKEDVTITLDKNRFYTQILTLNLNTGLYRFTKIKKPLFSISKMKKRANSFIVDNFIFITSASKDSLIVNIHNIKSRNLIKKISSEGNKSIPFKNTAIIQEGGTFNENRELEKTKKFLRKISNSNIAIVALKKSNGYEITIGSKKESSNPIVVLATVAAVYAGFNTGTLFNNFMSDNFNFSSYSNDFSLNTKTIHIKSLFDHNFNHLKGKIKKNNYDKIFNFLKPKEKKEIDGIYSNNTEEPKKAINIFNLKNGTILGFYSSKLKKYYFYKFTN